MLGSAPSITPFGHIVQLSCISEGARLNITARWPPDKTYFMEKTTLQHPTLFQHAADDFIESSSSKRVNRLLSHVIGCYYF